MAKLPRFVAMHKGKIRGYTQAAFNLADLADVRHVVGRLRFDHLDPAGREMRIGSRSTVRLDRQGNPTDGGANLQVQLNDPNNYQLPKNSKTTIGQVVVPKEIFNLANNCPNRNVRVHLESFVRSALIKSSTSNGYAFVITES